MGKRFLTNKVPLESQDILFVYSPIAGSLVLAMRTTQYLVFDEMPTSFFSPFLFPEPSLVRPSRKMKEDFDFHFADCPLFIEAARNIHISSVSSPSSFSLVFPSADCLAVRHGISISHYILFISKSHFGIFFSSSTNPPFMSFPFHSVLKRKQ